MLNFLHLQETNKFEIMRFDLRKFFAFGLLASLAFLLISGIVLYFAPSDNQAGAGQWLFLSIPKISWKTQFIFSFFFVLIFLALFLIKINWNKVKNFLHQEFPRKVSSSKELWIALVLVFILVSISGADIPVIQYLTRVQTTGPAENTQYDNYKVTKDEMVRKGEKLSKGKPVSKRTLNEAIEEIEITREDALTIFARKKIQHTGNFNLTLEEIARENDLSAMDLYAILSGKEPPAPPTNRTRQEEKKPDSDYIKMIAAKNLDELVEIIAKEQPGANVTKEIILKRLDENQIKLENDKQVLGQIAGQNKISVDDLMQIIHTGRRPSVPPVAGAKKLDGPPPHIKKGQDRARYLKQTSITKIATEYKLDEGGLLKALKDNGYEADKHQTPDDIAKAYNVVPGTIMKVLKEEKDRQEKK